MSYTNVYPSRINWENEPSIASPINATNLNKLDYAAYEFDQTFETWDVTKANQSDLLLSVKSIDYDTTTGVFVFTWQNGTTKTVDLNIEKIPVSFSMSPQGVITMTTEDGTQYTADVGSLIKTYTFDDSTEIDFTVTTDASGNKTVTAAIKDGSIVGTKLEPNYLANCQSAANSASGSATAADGSAEDSEAWAVGTRDGVPVPSTDPAYNNNSKYWATQGGANSLSGLSDTDINSPTDGQGLVYNYSTSKWINGNVSSGSTITVFTNESSLYGRTVTLTIGQQTKTETFSNVGVVVFKGIVSTGTFTITSSTSGGDTATATLDVPYFGNYTKQLTLFSATVTITFPYSSGATCTLSDGSTTLSANTSPMAFDVPNSGTWVATCTLDGLAQTESFSITTDGQTESHTFTYGTINLTYDNEFRGLSLTCSQTGGSTITKTAPSGANSMSFYPDATGTWEITGTYSGQSYSTGEITVSSLSTAVSANLQTYIVATVTLHGAVGATISYVDVTGLQTKALDENGECANVVVKCDPSNPYVSFVDTNKSKLPEDLTKSYFKRVEITGALTDIYITPDNALYWYGYKSSNFETCNTANGWSHVDNRTLDNPTYNANDIYLVSAANHVCYVGSKSSVSDVDSVSALFNDTLMNGGNGLCLDNLDSKQIGYGVDYATTTGMQIKTASLSGTKYLAFGSNNSDSRAGNLYGLWTNTTPSGSPTYYSAAYDMLYIKDTSNNIIPIAVTDAEGKAYDALLPNGTYTIYSSVAKNPDSLSDAYSKTVTITNATSDVYVMPDLAIYWHGNKDYTPLQTESSGTITGQTLVAPTFNKNYASFTATSSQGNMINSKVATSQGSYLKSLVKNTGGTSNGLGSNPSKTVTGTGWDYTLYDNDSTLKVKSLQLINSSSQDHYAFTWTNTGQAANAFELYAMWYE